MLDLALLRILKWKEHYDRLVPSLPRESFDSRTIRILDGFGVYLKKTGHPVVKMPVYKEYFRTFLSKGLTKEELEYYENVIDNCTKNVDPETTREFSNSLVELSFATDVGNDAMKYHRGDDVDILNTVGLRHELARAKILSGDTKDMYVTDDIGDILAEEHGTTGLQWKSKELSDQLRDLVSGDMVIVAGRPDTGKTSFLTYQLSGMVHGLDPERPVLWLCNEGSGRRIVSRCHNSFLGKSTDELVEMDKEGVLKDAYIQARGNMVNVIDAHDWDTTMVTRVVEDTKPGLVVFDMLDNIIFKNLMRGGDAARTDQVLEEQYQWARKLGVKYDFPVIATSQVSADVEQSAETQCYPPLHALKDSKTGKQGAADLVVMLGRSPDPMCANTRYVSTPKNKRSRGFGSNYIRTQLTFDLNRGTFFDPVN